MIEEYINDYAESWDSIDTSTIENDTMDEEMADFYDSIGRDESILLDLDLEDFNSDGVSSINDAVADGATVLHSHTHQEHTSSSISFTGNGRCRVCSCGSWAGFGNTCENCGHFYNKHI